MADVKPLKVIDSFA